MSLITRRTMLAAAGTLAAGLAPRNSHAAESLPPLASLLKLTTPPAPPAEIVFTDRNGAPHRLGEFQGHGMVINLWATWCVPCVAEMPSLAVLARALAPSDIAVMPLSSDRGGLAKVEAFYAEHHISALPILLDPRGEAGTAWGVRGIPTTLIIDRQGRERARAEGAADWSTQDAAEVIRRLVA
jgi:thiol-disulfide isomerase/thioredoxin